MSYSADDRSMRGAGHASVYLMKKRSVPLGQQRTPAEKRMNAPLGQQRTPALKRRG